MSKSEEEMLKKLVESMGISSYDPLLLSALGEYSRRLTTEIICDAMDVAEHDQRKAITTEDLKVAIKISGAHLHSQKAEAESVLAELQKVVNSQSILQDVDKEMVMSQYPRSHYNSLTQRCFTYVCGSTAYPPQPLQAQSAGGTDSSSLIGGDPKDQKPISLQIKQKMKQSRPLLNNPVDEES